MARKASKDPSAAFFPGLGPVGPVPGVRPLPPNAQGLFLPGLVAEAARSKQLVGHAERREAAWQACLGWISVLRAGTFLGLNETQVEGEFVEKLLKPLGYQGPTDVLPGAPWTMMPKLNVPDVGPVDYALGHFRPHERDSGRDDTPIVMVELKGAGNDLDRKGSRDRSAVQQVWEYVNGSDSARWAIVSNYVEIRLYNRTKGSRYVHRVLIDQLDDPARFAEYFAVFHADSLLGTASLSLNAAKLLEETTRRQQVVTEELYQHYAEQRTLLIEDIQKARSDLDLDAALAAAQKLLDRILFVAFAEDRQLLPSRKTIDETAASRRPGSTRWRAFQDLFRALDVGDDGVGIAKFNGELFKPDAVLDDPAFRLDDVRWPTFFRTIGGYDFRDEVTVDVLGRLFELSIEDIEKIRSDGPSAQRAALDERRRSPGRRKREGVYYTDPSVTGYLVAAALDPAWEANRAALLEQHGLSADLPRVPETPEGQLETEIPPSPAHARYLRDRLAWLDDLTVCDPACGSGAFMVAAYEWFENRRIELLDHLKHVEPDAPEAVGDRDDWAARSAPLILSRNLYGVDLSPESVEIARLSLWIRTARRGQPLTNLADNVAVGNSVVDDPEVDPKRAFNWHARFPEVLERGGFDAVVGNPPYVRQELLGPIKPHLAGKFAAYHGMADLYVYFYERALSILRPGGRLAYVVTNKWMKAGYGEPLRRLFSESSWVESVIDFGHAKPFFKDADVFPCFLVVRKPDAATPPETARVCVIPRELVRMDELRPLVEERSLTVERSRLGSETWNLEPRAVNDLLEKIRRVGVPLSEFAGVKPYRGILTGLNEAFLIDTPTRNALIQTDPDSAPLLKPYLRGQDIERWQPEWAGLWMIALKSSGDHPWPWADLGDQAEAGFAAACPGVYQHLLPFKDALIRRQDQGRFWWELRSCAYWDEFDKPKIVYQEIQFHSSYSFEPRGRLGNNKTFFIVSEDHYLLGVLNSPLMWWHNWRYLPHMKDEALSPVGFLMESLPIAPPRDQQRSETETTVDRLLTITETIQSTRRDLLDWLQVDHEVAKPTTRLRDLIGLDSDGFVAEVKKAKGLRKSLTVAGLKQLREAYLQRVEPARRLASEALGQEARLNDLVNDAYGLTPAEVRLFWDTAPPRMPIPRPAALPPAEVD